jgi:hypothetical protein
MSGAEEAWGNFLYRNLVEEVTTTGCDEKTDERQNDSK